MPIRDVEAFFPTSPKPLRFLAGRGANGIDGVASSAAGAALGSGRPTFLLTGDVALLHDVGGLLPSRRAGAEITVVCLNNDGGGIFDFLPVATAAEAEAYERHIATPHGIDLAALAALAGLEHRSATTVQELRDAVARPRSWRCARIAGPTSRSTGRWWRAWPVTYVSSGSSAWSLTSVSASSSAGTESRTIPQPA